MAPEWEMSAALEQRQLLAGMGQLRALHESQLWAKIGMGNTTNAKLQIMGQWPNMKSQQWAEMGLGLKQYHKGQIIWGQLWANKPTMG